MALIPILSRVGSGFGFGSGNRSPASFDILAATDIYTSPYTSSSRSYTKLEFILVGAGGADNNPWPVGPNPLSSAQIGGGGQGGFTVARFIVPTSTTLLYAVGSTGSAGEPGPGAGGDGWLAGPGNLAGGSGYSAYVAPGTPPLPAGTYGGGGGGGGTGVFVSSVSQANALAIAGGGGGTKYGTAFGGGNGGGLTADAAPQPPIATNYAGGGGGGSQIAGGAGAAGGGGGSPGIALGGGNNSIVSTNVAGLAYAGGGGGGGNVGGGGGGASGTGGGADSGGGGGGSGFINSSSPLYVPSPTVERNYTGMGDPAMGSGAGGPYPLGAGKDHPQISPYWISVPTKYGAGAMPGILLVNYYV